MSRGLFLAKLKELKLPVEDFAIFGSGPLLVRGIIDESTDIDIVARGKAWEAALQRGSVEEASLGGQRVWLNEVEIYTQWGYGGWATDDLIDTADLINGMRFVKLDFVMLSKVLMRREKDKSHLKLLRKYLFKKI